MTTKAERDAQYAMAVNRLGKKPLPKDIVKPGKAKLKPIVKREGGGTIGIKGSWNF